MKQRPVLTVFSILAVLIAIVGGVWLYDWVLGSTLEASEPITAAPVIIATPVPTSPAAAPMERVQATASAQPAVETQPAAPVPTTAAAQPTAAQPEAQPASALEIYRIIPEQSQVRFSIYEEFNGAPTTVVGVTDQVAGEAALNLSDLSQTILGEIRINARTLVTDQDRRNTAIRNRILNTDRFEYITFQPREVIGLSGSAQPGQALTFQISGDLTIRDAVQPVVFDVTAVLDSENRIAGSAATTVQYRDFGILVPSVPFVANVGSAVLLEIDFVLAQ